MRHILILSTCSIALLAGSCGENKTVDSQQQEPLAASTSSMPEPKRAQSAQASRNNQTPARQGNSAISMPPRDAQWTILCTIIQGPGHVERVRQAKDELMKSSKMSDWHVTHEEARSTLFYGYYKTIDPDLDAKEAQRYRNDRARLAQLQDPAGNRFFAEARPAPIDSPDPVAPAELNLVNAQGYWSLQIAAYQGPGRKEAAVEAAKEARKMGIEAYFHHGPNVSAVCVGAWPEEAIRKQQFDGGAGVDRSDQDQPLLVLGPGARLPESIKQQYANELVDKDSGRKIKMLEQRVEVVDPMMRAAMEKFPTHSVNGYEDVKEVRDPATGQMVKVPVPSLPVPIPHSTSVLQAGPTDARPNLLSPQATPHRGTGQLRSVGP